MSWRWQMVLCYRKRISATEAIDHPFLELANHRGLGNRITLDRHRAYMFRRKWEVLSCSSLISFTLLVLLLVYVYLQSKQILIM